MPNIKVLCPYCKITSIEEQLFDVNSNLEKCYCPKCMRLIEVKDARKQYEDSMAKYLKKADFTLYVKCDAETAYKQYGDILNIDRTYLEAYLGRIMSLLYFGTLRKSYIKEASTLYEEEISDVIRASNKREAYFKFISKASSVLDEYLLLSKRKLTFKKYFYDEECLTLYLQRINEILSFKKILSSEATYLAKHSDEAKAGVLANALSIQVEELNKKLNLNYRTVNGDLYHLDKIKRDGSILLASLDDHINTHLSRYRMASLNKKSKEFRQIKDVIFVNYRHLALLIAISSFFLILFVSGAGICGYYTSILEEGASIALLFAAIICSLIGFILISLLSALIFTIRKRMLKMPQ